MQPPRSPDRFSALLARDGIPAWAQPAPYSLPPWPAEPRTLVERLRRFFGNGSRVPHPLTEGLADTGLYVTYRHAGHLQHVAAWNSGQCQSCLYVDRSGPRGWYYDRQGLGLAYYSNHTMETFHPWDDDSPAYPATTPFDAWVTDKVRMVVQDEVYRRDVADGFPLERAGRCRHSIYSSFQLVAMARAGVQMQVVDLRPPGGRRMHYPVPGALAAIPAESPKGIVVVLLEWHDDIDKVRAAVKRKGGPHEAICSIPGGGSSWLAFQQDLRRAASKGSPDEVTGKPS